MCSHDGALGVVDARVAELRVEVLDGEARRVEFLLRLRVERAVDLDGEAVAELLGVLLHELLQGRVREVEEQRLVVLVDLAPDEHARIVGIDVEGVVQHARLGGVDRVVCLLRELEIGGDVLRLDGDARDEDERGGGVERGHGRRFFLEALFFFFEIKMASGKRVRIESMFALYFFTFGRY